MRKINDRQGALPAVPAGSRVYAVGDVHGRLDLLVRLEELIAADAAAADARRRVIVYLGDYVDRGPDSQGVIERLLRRPLPGFEPVHLLGNHEDYLLQFLENAEVGPAWCAYGGLETLASYGVRPPSSFTVRADDFEIARQALADKIPPAHVAFMRDLKLTHAEGGYLFVHAGVKPGVALAEQQAEDLLWIRNEFLDSAEDFGACVVHGHTIVEAPEQRANRIGIDTGAFATGTLTALLLDSAERRFIQT
ncbi:MAG: serine/threonine protein phosphatase [Alphaproteobacteria bacterium]|nr:serine/threonine protein phosphatase [Alphaproteobacteria bacterium]